MPKILIAVLSDIHAASAQEIHSSGSNVIVPAPGGRRTPINDLKTLVNEGDLKADYLMCPGDITNQADAAAFQWMWAELQTLGTALHAREVVATCGNHDLDSRYLMEKDAATGDDDPDARGAILSLQDRFPALTEEEHSFFWAHNFVVLERAKPAAHRILLLNTCAYHGSNLEEIKHGRVSARTIRRIIERLRDRPRIGLNLLLCHHHLTPMTHWGAGADHEYVKKGSELLRQLEELGLGPWLVIHGHRHWPECSYAAGGSGSPVVFCSGSFGKAEAQVVNQFHLLEVDISTAAARPKGVIRTWFWSLSKGWNPSMAQERSLAFESGFGFDGSLSLLAEEVAAVVPRDSFMDWAELVGEKPALLNLLPRDFELFKNDLKQTHSVRISMEDGLPVHISFRKEQK